MKYYMMAVTLMAVITVTGQDTLSLNERDAWKLREMMGSKPRTYSYTPDTKLIDLATLSHTLPNGNKVYALPQDNMPCVVPDISAGTMPTVKPPTRGQMPNPAVPLIKKPLTLTKEQLQRLLELKMQQKKKDMLHR